MASSASRRPMRSAASRNSQVTDYPAFISTPGRVVVRRVRVEERCLEVDSLFLEARSHSAQAVFDGPQSQLSPADDPIGQKAAAVHPEALAVSGLLGEPQSGSELLREGRDLGTQLIGQALI